MHSKGFVYRLIVPEQVFPNFTSFQPYFRNVSMKTWRELVV